ncbi:MAG: hypothetical protein AAF823_13035 [Planctomycetota bacterium]
MRLHRPAAVSAPRSPIAAGLAAALAILTLGPAAAQVGEPENGTFASPRTISASWNLDFRPQLPRPIAVPDLAGVVRWYWYVPYTVTNNSGSEQLYVPETTIFTDSGSVIPANNNVPPPVFAAIKTQLGNDLLESPTQVLGEILQGPDHARESVIVWPHFEQDVDRFTLFVAGLSGETATVPVPGTDETTLVRRTKAFTYATPGDYQTTPQGQSISLVGEEDVMR